MPWGWRAGCPHTDWGVGRQIAGATDLILHSALCILFLLRFLGAQGFELGHKGVGVFLLAFFIDAAADEVVADQKNDGQENANDEAGGGLHEHCDISGAGDAGLIDADQLVAGDEALIIGVVVITTGAEHALAVLFCDLHNTVGDDAGAVALGVEERDHIAHFDFGGLDGTVDDQVAAFDLRVHRIRQNDEREDASNIWNFIFIDKALGNQRHINDEDRN